MADRTSLAEWWEKERQRDFTKLECGVLGGLFAAIAIILLLVVRLEVG
jgi:hypothetical protein